MRGRVRLLEAWPDLPRSRPAHPGPSAAATSLPSTAAEAAVVTPESGTQSLAKDGLAVSKAC